MIRQILTWPNEKLAQVCPPIEQPDSLEIRNLASDMIATVRKHRGLGLAAPQVGYCVRLIVAVVKDREYVIVNPVITNRSGRQKVREGCLSVPGLVIETIRPMRIKVTGTTVTQLPIKITAKRLLAHVLCHEIDHLNGQLIIHRPGRRVA